MPVKCIFNPPGCPWWGGFYERLVGVIKSPLKKILGKALLSVKELSTVIKEVEGIVNDRPKTYVGCFDDERPLTPSMLIGNIWNKETVHVTSESRKELTTQTVEQATRWLRYVEVSQHWKGRWYREYLAQLRHFQWKTSKPIVVGELVFVIDNYKKRQNWKSGLGQRTFEGNYGKARVADVEVGKKIFRRAFQRLIPLEIRNEN